MVKFVIANDISYSTLMTHINNDSRKVIEAICDTGCTTTSIGLRSLSILLGVSVDVLKNEIESRLRKGYPIIQTSIADGSCLRNVPIIINCIYIGSRKFDSLYCLVNIDEVKYGYNCSDRSILHTQMQAPYILIGLDILRAFNRIEMNKNEILCEGFNQQFYDFRWSHAKGLWKVYLNMPIKESNPLGLATSLPDIF